MRMHRLNMGEGAAVLDRGAHNCPVVERDAIVLELNVLATEPSETNLRRAVEFTPGQISESRLKIGHRDTGGHVTDVVARIEGVEGIAS